MVINRKVSEQFTELWDAWYWHTKALFNTINHNVIPAGTKNHMQRPGSGQNENFYRQSLEHHWES